MESNNLIQQLYVAFYGRPADPEGLAYWEGRLAAADGNLASIVGAFVDSEETAERFGSEMPEARFNAILQAAFGREASPAEQAALSDAMAQEGSLPAAVLSLLADASEQDAEALAGRVEVANAFTTQVAESGAAYGSEGIAAAVALLMGVEPGQDLAAYILERVPAAVDSLPAQPEPEPEPEPQPEPEPEPQPEPVPGGGIQVELETGSLVYSLEKQSVQADGVSSVSISESEIDAFEAALDGLFISSTQNFGDIITLQTGDDTLQLVIIDFVGESPLRDVATQVGYDDFIDLALFNGELVTAESLGISEQEFFFGERELTSFFGYDWPGAETGPEVISRMDGQEFTFSIELFDSLGIANLQELF